MSNDTDLSNEALLVHRAIAEKATSGNWEKSALTAGYIVHCDEKHHEVIASVVEYAPDGRVAHIFDNAVANAAHIAANPPDVVKAHVDEILRLRAEVKRLNKEADWLAHHAWKKLGVRHMPERDYDCMECPYDHNCVKCWREWACKEVEKRV